MRSLRRLFKTYGKKIEEIEKRQKRVFIKFINYKLQNIKNRKPLESITELSSGIDFYYLIKLYSSMIEGSQRYLLLNKLIITNQNRVKNKIIKLNNITVLLSYLKKSESAVSFHFDGINAINIVNGNEKMIIGLLIQIILYYQVKIGQKKEPGKVGEVERDDEDVYNVKNVMIDWINSEVLPKTEKKISDINDYSLGTPFFYLIQYLFHKFSNSTNSHVIPHFDLDVNNCYPSEMIEKSMNFAEKQFGIPQIIGVNDVVSYPDEITLVLYLSFFKNYSITDYQQQQLKKRKQLRKKQKETSNRRKKRKMKKEKKVKEKTEEKVKEEEEMKRKIKEIGDEIIENLEKREQFEETKKAVEIEKEEGEDEDEENVVLFINKKKTLEKKKEEEEEIEANEIVGKLNLMIEEITENEILEQQKKLNKQTQEIEELEKKRQELLKRLYPNKEKEPTETKDTKTSKKEEEEEEDDDPYTTDTISSSIQVIDQIKNRPLKYSFLPNLGMKSESVNKESTKIFVSSKGIIETLSKIPKFINALRIVNIGDYSVGKTSVLKRFLFDQFSSSNDDRSDEERMNEKELNYGGNYIKYSAYKQEENEESEDGFKSDDSDEETTDEETDDSDDDSDGGNIVRIKSPIKKKELKKKQKFHSNEYYNIIDTNGEEKYLSLSAQYFRDIHGLILQYDVNNKESLLNCSKWLKFALRHITPNNNSGKCIILLLGNKKDDPNIIQTQFHNDVMLFINEFGTDNTIIHYEVSAKFNHNQNVHISILNFLEIVSLQFKNSQNFKESIRINSGIILDHDEKTKPIVKRGCCEY